MSSNSPGYYKEYYQHYQQNREKLLARMKEYYHKTKRG